MNRCPLDTETERKLARVFGPEDQVEVRGILETECGENIPGWSSANLIRLRQGALKVSGGNVHKLRQLVDLAKIDFRDALMWAGFGDVDSHIRWEPAKRLG
jgi:hypothetical protein